MVLHDVDMGECCTQAQPTNKLNHYWHYNMTSRECQFYTIADGGSFYVCNNSNTIMGLYEKPPPYGYCECDRVFKSIGREDIAKALFKIGGSFVFPAGGEW